MVQEAQNSIYLGRVLNANKLFRPYLHTTAASFSSASGKLSKLCVIKMHNKGRGEV